MKNCILILTSFFLILHAVAQNSSLAFNGTTQYISVPDQNSIDLSNNFTIEGWVYPTGTGSAPVEGGIIVNKESSYEIARFADGTLQYALSANGNGTDWAWVNSGIILPVNSWSHFAFVKSGTSVTIYLNGSSLYSNVLMPATLTANTQELRIGNRSSASSYLNGRTDEIRIWNIVRTQTDIKTYMFNRNLANNASGLVAYYRMNEGSGGSTVNSGTNFTGLNGTLVNAPSWVASPVQYTANALSFDGLDDTVTIPYTASLDITTAITLESWVYATKNTGIQNVISKSSSTFNNGYIFPRTDNGWTNVIGYLNIGGSWKTLSAAYPSLNAWHHLALTYDGSTMKLYIDGVLANSLAQTGIIVVNTNSLALGNQPGFSEYFGGYADEMRIWNVARTQAQLQASMNKELDPATQTGLVSYYTFNQGLTTGANAGLVTAVDQKGNNNGTLTNFASSGGTSNFVAQFSSLATLPVIWRNFTAQKQGDNVLLNWSTASEQNSASFTVQYSTDGLSWNDAGTLPAAGNSSLQQQYSFVHTSPASGANYYRIMLQDLDGKFSYSKVIGLVLQSLAAQIKIYPNPVTNGVLHIQLPNPAAVSVYTSIGILVIRKHLPAGMQQLDMSGFAKGSYQVKVGGEVLGVVVQ